MSITTLVDPCDLSYNFTHHSPQFIGQPHQPLHQHLYQPLHQPPLPTTPSTTSTSHSLTHLPLQFTTIPHLPVGFLTPLTPIQSHHRPRRKRDSWKIEEFICRVLGLFDGNESIMAPNENSISNAPFSFSLPARWRSNSILRNHGKLWITPSYREHISLLQPLLH